jgi:nucleotide-binding universal stress UspA family protein
MHVSSRLAIGFACNIVHGDQSDQFSRIVDDRKARTRASLRQCSHADVAIGDHSGDSSAVRFHDLDRAIGVPAWSRRGPSVRVPVRCLIDIFRVTASTRYVRCRLPKIMRAYDTILVGIDFSPRDDLAIRAACGVAAALSSKRIHLAHVVTPYIARGSTSIEAPSAAYNPVFREVLEGSKTALDLIEVRSKAAVTREVRAGPAVRELAACAVEVKADLIILVSHRRGRLGRFVLGSVATAVMRAAPCPLLVIGADRPLRAPIRRVLAAIDGSAASELVLEHASHLAARQGGRVQVLSVFDLERSLQRIAGWRGLLLGELTESLEARHRSEIRAITERAAVPGVDLAVEVRVHDHARDCILETAQQDDVDLIAVGTSGHNAWERMMLGSTATDVVADAPCPVLVIPVSN